jgi:hypothetical protein
MNDDNLIPQNKRTKSEQREIAKKGGKKSGEIRRKNRDFREAAQDILSRKIPKGLKPYADKIGLLKSDTPREAVVMGIAAAAIKGDAKAAAILTKWMGEDTQNQSADDKLGMFLDALQERMAEDGGD